MKLRIDKRTQLGMEMLQQVYSGLHELTFSSIARRALTAYERRNISTAETPTTKGNGTVIDVAPEYHPDLWREILDAYVSRELKNAGINGADGFAQAIREKRKAEKEISEMQQQYIEV